MLTLFRRLRKGLLGTGATRKYLLYAAGEILLVMVGILLALQVNNWNINRINIQQEIKYLQRIVQDLNMDLSEIEKVVVSNHYRLFRSKYILETMGANNIEFDNIEIYSRMNEIVTDSAIIKDRSFGIVLGGIRYYDAFNVTNNAFEELLGNGKIDIIRNEEIKNSILDHYSQLEDKLQLINMTETMRNEFVQMLAIEGFSMYNKQSYEEFDKNYTHKNSLIAQIENIVYITISSQLRLRYGKNSIENETKSLVSKIETYLE